MIAKRYKLIKEKNIVCGEVGQIVEFDSKYKGHIQTRRCHFNC